MKSKGYTRPPWPKEFGGGGLNRDDINGRPDPKRIDKASSCLSHQVFHSGLKAFVAQEIHLIIN